MKNNISEKWNLSKRWPYIRDMKNTSLKDNISSISQSSNSFLSRVITVSVMVAGNLLVCLLFLWLYLIVR